VHGYHGRTVADVPVDGRQVVVRLPVRRLACPILGCARQTFREQTTRDRLSKVHTLLSQGVGLLDCARRLGLALNTVKLYARMPEPSGLHCR
jgi:hypothetical protein